MKLTFNTAAAAAAIAFAAPFTASAAVLNFDDLTGADFFSGTYQGFKFGVAPTKGSGGSWFYSDVPQGGLSLYKSPHTSISTETAFDANNNPTPMYGDSLAISSATAFTLQGAYFAGLDDVPVKLKLYYQGAKVAESAELSLTYGDAPVFLATGYTGLVDSFVVESYHGYFAMDDVIYNAVPEPGTYALMLCGLVAVGALVRRRCKASN